MHEYAYIFGAPALPRPPSAVYPCETLILGAYPSALHVRWMSIDLASVAAVAVADEPEPFWDGRDESAQFLRWLKTIAWDSEWGEVAPAGRLNGSSGVWLTENVLCPLGLKREDVWITDCLDTYHESKGASVRLDSTQFRRLIARSAIPDRNLPAHPTEAQIVSGAQVDRLASGLRKCRPSRVITLDNAALRVFIRLLDQPPPLPRLSPDNTYGCPHSVRILLGSSAEWMPLAHPAAPAKYQESHRRWITRSHSAA